MSTGPNPPPKRVNTTVAQAFEAMRVIAQSPRPLTFTEVADRLQLPVATAHRILVSLETSQYIERLLDDHYISGVALNEAREAIFRSFPITDHTENILAELAQLSGETAALNCRFSSYVVRVDGFESRSEMRRRLHLGEVYPLHLGAGGRAVLAYLADQDIEAYGASGLLADYPTSKFQKVEELGAELRQVKADGFALDSGDFYSEAHSIAWPVFGDRDGTPIASLLIAGPARRFKPREDAEFQKAAAQEIALFQDEILTAGEIPASPFRDEGQIKLNLAPYE